MRKGITIGFALTLLALPASAQVAEPQALVITAENVTATEAERADALTGVSIPGDVIEYRLTFTNLTDGPVSDVVLNEGLSWSENPVIEVDVAGESVTRPAPADAYTHVRWTITGAVSPGAQVTARFRARVAGEGTNGGAS